MKEPVQLFFIQLLSYSVITLAWRAVSKANIPASMAIDVFYSWLTFTVIRRVAKASDSRASQAAYALGSSLGTGLGILVSLYVLGK